MRDGRVTQIGIRTARRQSLREIPEVEATTVDGLCGDHYSGKSGARQVTLIQAEHIACIASFLGVPELDALVLRRNLVVEGINLLALKGAQFQVGDATLEYTGPCHPCSRMESVLGPGGYQASRGHGGITARVVDSGLIRRGDVVRLI